MTQEQKMQIAQQLAEKRRVMGDSGFSAYLNKVEQAIPQRQAEQRQNLTESVATVEEPKGILGFLGKVTGVSNLARGAAAGLNAGNEAERRATMLAEQDTIQTNLVNAIKEQKKLGKDTSRLEKTLQDYIGENQAINEGMRQRADLGVTNREVVGSAIRTVGTIAGAGQFGGAGATTGRLSTVTSPQLTSATTVGRGVAQGFGTGLAAGAKSGTIFGGVSGLATGVEENKGVLGTAFEIAKQGAIGGAVGGAVGGVTGAVGGGFQARANRKQELAEILSASDNVDEALAKATPTSQIDELATPEATPVAPTKPLRSREAAGFTLKDGKVVEDKKAQRLLKLGFDDKDVTIMQSMSDADKVAAKEMVKIVKEVSDTGIATRRQQEVVGKAFMRRAKDVELLNKQAGQQIDDIARTKLSGVKVNASQATDDFFNQLERAGVDVDSLRLAESAEDIARAFDGSDFEGITTAQKTIKTVLKRVDPALDGADMDGLALHRAKRFIDNQVTYGKNAEGLVGDAERLLKGLRSSIDDVLDTQFPDYNTANTQYKDTINALDEMRRIIGRDFLGSQDIANLRAGEVMNRLLGNASARPLSALQNLENTAARYGKTYQDNIIKQITFADLLDDVYQTVPSRGLAGGVETGVQQATGFMNKMRQSGFLSASIDKAAEVGQSALGITPEARQKAIEEFLGLSVK